MEYRLLGNSGCAVSALALGTLTFGNETDAEGSFAQLDRFTEVGGSLIDTGTPDYPYGEKGQAQRSRRVAGGRF